jgi:hypothetical protein
MKRQKSRLAEKRSLDALLKQLGIERVEAFRRADLTAELRDKTGLTPEEEFQLAAVAEMHGLGLPLEAARALGFSRAVGSAPELAALKAEEIEQVLKEAAVRDLVPEGFEINLGLIEQWLQRIQPLAADEDPSARNQVAEDQEQRAAGDEDAALAAEDESLNRQTVDELLAALQERWRSGEAAVRALARGAGDKAEAAAVRDALLALQADISSVIERVTAREVGGFAALDEERATALGDDALEPVRDIHLLEDELKRIQMTLDDLRTAAESGDEDGSPAAAIEESQGDGEVALRGE